MKARPSYPMNLSSPDTLKTCSQTVNNRRHQYSIKDIYQTGLPFVVRRASDQTGHIYVINDAYIYRVRGKERDLKDYFVH